MTPPLALHQTRSRLAEFSVDRPNATVLALAIAFADPHEEFGDHATPACRHS